MKIRSMLLFLAIALLSTVSALGKSRDAYEMANELYNRAQYDSAAIVYEAILSSGQYNADVYYNLGNTYYRLKQFPLAILNYERALKVKPSHADARSNLMMAQAFSVDRLPTLESSPFSRWLKGIPHWMTERGWGILALICLALSLATILIFRFFANRGQWLMTGIIALFLLLVAVGSFIFARLQHSAMVHPSSAIIIQSVVSVKSSPDDASKDLFLLHGGTKVKLLESLGDWQEISISEGKRGWVDHRAIAGI